MEDEAEEKWISPLQFQVLSMSYFVASWPKCLNDRAVLITASPWV